MGMGPGAQHTVITVIQLTCTYMYVRVGGIHFFQYRLTSHYNTSVLLNTD